MYTYELDESSIISTMHTNKNGQSHTEDDFLDLILAASVLWLIGSNNRP